MSLKKSITTRDGIEHPDAYIKLVRSKFDHVRKTASMSLKCWHDQAAKEANKSAISGVPVRLNQSIREDSVYDEFFALETLEAEGANERKQCYAYLKTQIPGTTDV